MNIMYNKQRKSHPRENKISSLFYSYTVSKNGISLPRLDNDNITNKMQLLVTVIRYEIFQFFFRLYNKDIVSEDTCLKKKRHLTLTYHAFTHRCFFLCNQKVI